MIKNYIKNLLRNLGYELIHTHSLKKLQSKTFSYHLKSLFEILNIQCVLDVGANIGGYRNFLREDVGYQGLIISFEPIPKYVEVLRKLAETDSQWFIYDFALGNENSDKEMNYMKKGNFSSFLEPDQTKVFIAYNANTVESKEKVVIKKLDSIINILKEEHLINNIYLKMDTQGYDLEVVKGSENTLPQVLALQTEMSLKNIYQNMPSFMESYEVLSQKGYEITGMFPIFRDSLLRIAEFDCVMINGGLDVKEQNQH